MDILTTKDLKLLLTQVSGPCVSLFLPTQRGGSEKDLILWKNALNEAEGRLQTYGLRAPRARDLLAPGRDLANDAHFWKEVSDGLAAFFAPEMAQTWRLPVSFPPLVLVADRFHVKPLLPLFAGPDRFYLLAISQNQVRFYRGDSMKLSPVQLGSAPRSLKEALRFHDRDEPLMFHSRPNGPSGWSAIFHGQGVGIDTHKDDLLLYFRQVNRGLHDVLRGERAPLVLASVDYLWPIYRQANTYPHLLDVGLAGNPDHLGEQELHTRAGKLVQPRTREACQKSAALYAQLAGTGRASADLPTVVRAALLGQVSELFIARDRECWGTIDAVAATITVHADQQAGDQDLLNLAGMHTLMHHGTVHAVESAAVPGKGVVAAIFRRPWA